MKAKLAILTLAIATSCNSIQAHEAGDFIARAGITNVSPDASSSPLSLNGGDIAGSSADVKDDTQLGLTFVYMFADNWGVEVLASTPFSHDITADTGELGLGTIDAGSTKHLPPTVSLQFYPAASDSTFQPYLGAGINYTHFFSEDVSSQLEGVLGQGTLDLDASWGIALQAGFDVKLTDNLLLNLGVWWIDIDTDARFQFDGANITTNVSIDPMVYSASLGWKF